MQRWLSLSNELHALGYQPVILTLDPDSANYPTLDTSLELRVHPDTKVIRTHTKELFWIYKKYIGKGKAPAAGFANEGSPNLIQKVARFIRGNFFIPDARKSWNAIALPEALKIVDREHIRTVITAGPPHSTHLMGMALQQKRNIRWIADFHDAWTDVWYYDKLMHTPMAARMDAAYERSVLEKADVVLTVGEMLREKLISKSINIAPEKIRLIPMGFDDRQFLGESPGIASKTDKEHFTITYTGTIDDSYHPEVFFRALAQVKAKFPHIPFRLQFIGLIAEGLKVLIKESGLEPITEYLGYVPHTESIGYLKQATVLLLVSPEVRSEDIIIPGKIYEYLAVHKPVINIGARSTNSARIISACDAGLNADRTMQTEIETYLSSLAGQWPEVYLEQRPEALEAIRSYSRKAIAAEIAEILKQGQEPV